MNLFDFIQWCFRDNRSAAATIIVGALLLQGVAEIFRAARQSR